MKKTIYYLLTALTVIAAVACTKSEPAEIKLVDKNFTAVLEGTKTFIDPLGTKICWEEGDDIAIFDNISTDAHLFSISIVDSTNATFSGQVAEGATTFYAVYPYAAAVSRDLSAETLSATLPAEQKLGDHNASQGAFLAVAKVNDGQIAFQNVFGRIKIQVTYADVSEIVVGGTNLAGTAAFSSVDGSIVGEVSEAASSVKLLPKEGDSVFPLGIYYISLLPGTTPANSFSVTMKRNVDGPELAYSASSTATAAVEVKQKGGINFANIDTKLEWTLHIDTADELIAWNNSYANWKANDKVFLDADIDLSTATPTSKADVDGSNWTAHAFPGTFDGQNHAIKNIHVENEGDANFFGTVSGTVKNLTFGAASDDDSHFYGTAASGSYNIGPIGTANGAAKIENVVNYSTVDLQGNSGYWVAGVCCEFYSTDSMKVCKNYGTVKVSGNPSTYVNLGGVVGACSSSSTTTLYACENHGSVLFDGVSTSQTFNHGGLLGYTSGSTKVVNCLNTGAVGISSKMTTPASQYRLGGIVGLNQGDGVKITDTDNQGAISCNATSFNGKDIYMGGMIGQNDCKSAVGIEIIGCNNSGNITAQAAGSAGNVYIGGILGNRTLNASTSSQSCAGIIGSATKPCSNTGVLSDLSARSAGRPAIGGIVGFNTMQLTISYCTNGEQNTEKGKVYRSGTGGYGSHYDLAGILAWHAPASSTGYADAKVLIDHCTNYAPVCNSASDAGGTYVYMSGILAANEPNGTNYTAGAATIQNTVNYGNVSNYAPAKTQVRTGCFMGDSANNTVITDCANYGSCTYVGQYNGTEGIRLSGFVGSSTKGSTGVQFTRCNNYGNIHAQNTLSTSKISYLAGLLGYTGLASSKFDTCKSSCTITIAGNTTTTARLICARVTSVTVKNCGVAGVVNGTTITADNYSNWLYNATSTTTVSGNYYMGSDNELFNPLDDDITLE